MLADYPAQWMVSGLNSEFAQTKLLPRLVLYSLNHFNGLFQTNPYIKVYLSLKFLIRKLYTTRTISQLNEIPLEIRLWDRNLRPYRVMDLKITGAV